MVTLTAIMGPITPLKLPSRYSSVFFAMLLRLRHEEFKNQHGDMAPAMRL